MFKIELLQINFKKNLKYVIEGGRDGQRKKGETRNLNEWNGLRVSKLLPTQISQSNAF